MKSTEEIEKVKQHNLRRKEKENYREIKQKSKRRWQSLNLEKHNADNKVRYALKMGKMQREPCQGCGSNQAVAHHEDYSKPLDVKWVCEHCHKAVHKGSVLLW
jgi:ribosomal protein S27AE